MGLQVSVLASGSSGNATLVSDGQTHLLVDCGLVAKEVERRMELLGFSCDQLSGILITHAHLDHFRSVGTIHRRFDVPVYVDPNADQAIRRRRSNGSYHRVERTESLPDAIGRIRITPFLTSHAVWGGRAAGFVLSENGAKVGVITDTGTFSREAVDLLKDCQVLVTEANYDPTVLGPKLDDRRYAMDWEYLRWVKSDHGHLSNDQCAELLTAVVTDRTRHVFLAHISDNHEESRKDNNSFERARDAVRGRFVRERREPPELHRTWRRGATEGRASRMVTIE